MAEITDYLKLGSEPVSVAAPGGEAVDFDDRLEQVKNEIRKLDSVNQTPVNWNLVVEHSSELLKKSKTFSLSTYLCLGLLETKGYAGLAAGLELCRDFFKNFWDTGFPPPARIKGRAEPYGWLSERGGRAVARIKPGANDLEPVKKALAVMEELSVLLQEKLANNNPGLVDLSRALHNRSSELERKAAPAAPASSASSSAAAPAGGTFPSEITTVEQADAVFPNVQDVAFQIAGAWRAADPTDPRPYILTRALMWGEILQPPPAEEKLTQIPGVRPELIEAWESMLSEENFGDLLEAAESYFGQTVFWFDLHRYVTRAMDGLGGEYAAARAAVVGQLKSFLGRLPELADFKFSDETPYASEETKKWLKAEVLSGGGGAPAAPEPAMPSATAVSEKLTEAVKKAGELAKKKKVNEAVNLFQEGIKSTPEKREQFIWRLGLARFCLGAKLPQVAIPHLEQLEREIGRFSLDDWEPQLALEALVLLHKAYQKAIDEDKAFPDTEEKAQKLFARLCQLDPMLALNLGKK